MAIERIKGIKQYEDRYGKWRCYHRKTGKPILAEYKSADFYAEISALDSIVWKKLAAKAGTLGGLIAA